jgi:hypothetical protein
MNKIIASMLFCLISFNLIANEGIEHLSKIGTADIIEKCDHVLLFKNIILQEKGLNNKAIYFQTNNVSFQYFEGHKFHVADYPDGSRVITIMDGNEKGFQAITFNGEIIICSDNVQWHKKYFVNFYPAGAIYTHPNMQICEFN